MSLADKFKMLLNMQQLKEPKQQGTYPLTTQDFPLWNLSADLLADNETIFSVITRLANTLASLPIGLYDGNNQPINNDLYKLVAYRPNANQTAFEFWNDVETDRNRYGNAFILINVNEYQQPQELILVPNGFVTIKRDSQTGYLWYDVRINNTSVLVPSYQMIHLKHLKGSKSDYGISPLDVLKRAVTYDNKVEEFLLNEMAKRDSFNVRTDGSLSQENKRELAQSIAEFARKNQGVLFSEKGISVDLIDRKISSTDIKDNDEVSNRRIANAFNIPISFLNESTGTSGYKSTEQQMTQFVQMTLIPILKQYESQLNTKLIRPEQWDKGYHFRFNENTLLRGDLATRTAAYQSAIRNGYRTPNDIRRLENEPMIDDEGANKLWLSGDLYPIDIAVTQGKVSQPQNKKGKEGDDELQHQEQDS